MSTPGVVAVLIITFIAGALGGVWLARRKKTAAALAVLAAVSSALTRGSLAHEGEDHGAPLVAAQPNGAREIAQMLGVSVKTVYRLRDASQLDSTAALTRFAAREGFAEESDASR